MLIWYLHSFFDEVSVKLLCLKKFFFLLLGFKSSLHILDDSPLSDMSFANSFSRSVACFLTLATVCCKVETFNVNSVLSHSAMSDSLWQVQLIGFFLDHAWGFPGGSDGKESACHAGDSGSIPGLGRPPWRREWQPTPVFLPGNFHG